MKNYIRLTTVIFIILSLLLSTFPASAGAQKIPFTGSCELKGFGNDPDFRYWFKAEVMEHFRNSLIIFDCDFDEDRLDGYYLFVDNWNINPHENSQFSVREFGNGGYMSDEEGNDLGLWVTSGHGFTDSQGTWGMNVLYKGRGMYQSMLAKTTWTTLGYPFYDVVGELLVP